jgi:60 kDa SS-A/Ro ribonucleoprotein
MKYNKTKTSTVTTVTNHQGGGGFKQEAKLELIGLLATGLDNTFYEKEGEREKRLSVLIDEVAKKDKTFVAKALIYARTKMGQRTITHVGAVNLAKYLSGDDLGKRFYSKRDRKENKGGIVFRLDDMLEISACYMAKNPGKPLSNGIKKGFKVALEEADAYELAKYQAKGKAVSLVDLVNLVHPKPSEKMKPVFEQLMRGELKQFNTVEDKNTKVGQAVAAKVKAGTITQAQADKELKDAKESNYAELIRTRKIGYLALLRNLRNILKNTSDRVLIDDACSLLTDEKLIRQSLVFPHQIDLALEIMLTEFSNSEMAKFAKALNTAYELAIPNLTELFTHGKTAVVFDSSGSMSTPIALSDKIRGKSGALDKAALIAATLAKGIGADVYTFADSCHGIKFNPTDGVNTIKEKLLSNCHAGGGTRFVSIFQTIGDKYNRVFVISDMQGADTLSSSAYANTHVYSVNMCGYGTTMFKPGNKVYSIFGYSADIYELVKKVEMDPKAILAEIEAIEI